MPRDQVCPSLFDPYYVIWKGRTGALQRVFRCQFDRQDQPFSRDRPALLLDLGGRESPYQRLARGYPVRWISVDIEKYRGTEIVLDAQALPFEDETFDFVLCTQVLALIPHPFRASEEVRRVLKRQGLAICTEAAIFPAYPGSRWRIMPDGWKTLLAGFSGVEIDGDCKTMAGFFHVINLYLQILLQGVPVLRAVGRYILCPLLNLVGCWANHRFKDSGFAANYIAIARK